MAPALIPGGAVAVAASHQSSESPVDGEQACPHHKHKHGGEGCPHGKGSAGGHHGGMGMFEHMGQKLELSESQKQEMAALMQMYGPRFKELMQKGAASREAIMNIPPDDSGYAVHAAELSKQAGESAAEAVTLLTEMQSNFYALLDYEQKARYLELRKQHQAKMEARRAAKESGQHSGKKCPACEWLEQDDAAGEAESK